MDFTTSLLVPRARKPRRSKANMECLVGELNSNFST